MSFWSKLFGKKKKAQPVKEEVKATEAVVDEPVVVEEPVVAEEPVLVEEPVAEEVVEEPVAEEVVEEPKSVNLNSLKVVELKELAKKKGIAGYSKMKKAELVEALKK